MRIAKQRCKRNLSKIWFIGVALIFFVLILQSYFNHYGTRVEEAWAWFLPSVLPNSSLIIGVFVSDAMGNNLKSASVDKFLYRLTAWFITVYLMLMLLTLLIQPLLVQPPLDIMKLSNLWLAPIQGLVTASLGIFYLQKEKQE